MAVEVTPVSSETPILAASAAPVFKVAYPVRRESIFASIGTRTVYLEVKTGGTGLHSFNFEFDTASVGGILSSVDAVVP